MGASETAGAVAVANWNSAAGASSASPLALHDQTGAATGASVTWSSSNTWNTPAADQAGNSRMMRGYLDTGNGNATSVVVAGLASGKYDIYVYTDGDNGIYSHTGVYQIGGSGVIGVSTSAIDAPNATFSGTFVLANNSAGNYIRFSSVSVTSGFTLTATPGATANVPRAAVNGIQIIPASTPDFGLSISPASGSATPGGSATYTVTVSAINAFTGTAGLTISGLPAGATGSFSPASVTGSGISNLTVSTIGSTPIGNSTLTIKAVSGSLTHSVTAGLTVAAPGSSPISIDFVGSGTAMASSESAGVVPTTQWNSASGASSSSALALVNQAGVLTGTTVSWTSDNGWALPISDVAGNVRMMRGYLDNGNGNPITVNIAGLAAGTYNIYVYVDGDNATFARTGIYQISGSGVSAASVSLTDAASTNFGGAFIQANNSNGNYVLFSNVPVTSGFTLTATPGATANVPRAPVNGIQIIPAAPAAPAFSLTPTPASQSLIAGGSTVYTIAVAPQNGFTGAVALAVAGLPSGASASFNPASVTTSGSSTLTVTTSGNAPSATSSLTITGADGSLTSTAGATLAVTAAQPATVSAGAAQSITLPATAQLSGSATSQSTITTLTYLWQMTSGPAAVTISSPSSPSTSVSFSTAGTYVFTLTASAGTLSASAQTTVTVQPAASVSATPDVVYPPNSGIINVQSYGATGNGSTDDTQAIINAMNAAWNSQANVVYFPAGTYRITQTLYWRQSNGNWNAFLRFQGQNQASTTIKLDSGLAAFSNASCDPLFYAGATSSQCGAMLYTASSASTDGIGGGENGYWNDVYDLTLDTGTNPGAQAIDWNCSNTAAIRNVTIKGSGRAGLNSARGSYGGGSGPCFVQNVTVSGTFDYGVVAGSGEVGVTYEHVTITNPRIAGFYNSDNNSWVRQLNVTTSGNVPAILNTGEGNFTVLDSTFTGSGGSGAISNSAWLFARNITTTGFASAINGVSGNSVSEYSSVSPLEIFPSSGKSMNLPISETPTPFTDNNFSNWAIVSAYGAYPGSGDVTAQIQNALNSGKPTVFFPAGSYTINGTLHIPSGVRRILGVWSNFATNGSAILECDSTSGGAVEITGGWSFVGNVSVLNKCTVPLVLRDFFNLYGGYSNTPGLGLNTYMENVASPGAVVQHGGNLWVRQLDIETDDTHAVNDGAKFWVLGYKTEGTGANGSGQGVWYTQNGGSTEILGAFNSTPGPGNYFGYFTVDSSTSISGLSSGYARNVVLTETHNGSTLVLNNTGNRYGGTAVTLYSASQ